MKYKILSLSNLIILLTILISIWATSELITPFLHYHLQQPAFLTSANFFYTFSAYPGGIADYLSEFIAQFFAFNWFGSILIVAIASLQGLIALAITRPFRNKATFSYSIFTLTLIFGILVLCNYYYPYYASIRLLVAYIFVWLYLITNSKNQGFSLITWFVLAVLLFYIASGFALFIFAISTTLIFLLSNKKPLYNLFIPAFLIFAGALPYMAYQFAFPEEIGNLYKIILVKPSTFQYVPENSVYVYYFLLPAILLLITSFRFFTKPNLDKETKQKSSIYQFLSTALVMLIQIIVCFAVGYYVYIKSHVPFMKNKLHIDYYAEHEDWKNVLKTAEKIEWYDYKVNFQICRAYGHFGTLANNIFDYPPMLGSQGLFIDEASKGNELIPISDLYFDLGYMDESQHWAYEAQTYMPNSPRIMKRLIMINLVNRNYPLATKFLDLLDENMLYHEWVKKYRNYITDSSNTEIHLLITKKRLFAPHKKTVCTENVERMKLLYDTNHDNRMAYDYLLSLLILESRYNDFFDYLQYYSHFNLKTLPKSWEEALVLYVAKYGIIPKKIPPEIISKRCTKEFSDFTEKMILHKDDVQKAKTILSNDYGNTYWYYYLYIMPTIKERLKDLNPAK